VGIGHPVIDATGQFNGVHVLASGSRIQGFTVENALGEGILVGNLPGPMGSPPPPAVSDVTISGNTVKNNDRGNPTGAPITTSSYGQCNVNPQNPNVPGDCGEGIHVINAFNNTVVGDTVTGTAAGFCSATTAGRHTET
jgi:hypothetical protein